MNLITSLDIFVLVRRIKMCSSTVSLCVRVSVSVCVTSIKLFFVLRSVPPSHPVRSSVFVCFSLGILLTQTPSEAGPPPALSSCFSFGRAPPAALRCISIIHAGTDSDEHSARLPAASIVCLIHSISPCPGSSFQMSGGGGSVFSELHRSSSGSHQGEASVFLHGFFIFQQTSFIIRF